MRKISLFVGSLTLFTTAAQQTNIPGRSSMKEKFARSGEVQQAELSYTAFEVRSTV